jgi:hypothetical protein
MSRHTTRLGYNAPPCKIVECINKNINVGQWIIEDGILHFWINGVELINGPKEYNKYIICHNGSPYYGCPYEYRQCEENNYKMCKHYAIKIFTKEKTSDGFLIRDKKGFCYNIKNSLMKKILN